MDFRSVLIVLAHLALLGVGGWLIVTDLRTHRLPSRIVLPTLASLIALGMIDAAATAHGEALVRALLGMLALGGFYTVLRLLSRSGMGGGDVKLAAVIGFVLAWHSWQAIAVRAASAFVLGSLFAFTLILLRRANGSTRIAFGPWMIAGALIGIVVG
ncbi:MULTISPECIES: A24 family peptidase [unclassified Microbacterium]|uniref:prepilin peptidase n=1 Tax=unclassified Microbacterium TaxID=2609290 RepID=UPI000EAABFC0|nr:MULTISPECIES: A24 family peptidase [unclassified Microbacterium]MBT2486370.1 prepilin peptidase [Microbacterium sp. ISL-108]RKN69078.1 prepilin peptidase [Microbacterium sp. CGR2]